VPGKPFAPPSGWGTQRLICTGDTGRCPACWHAVRLRLGGRTVAHNNEPGHCPGSSEPAAGDVPLACWLPGKDGLTPHGLRHGHKTWMTEDGIRGRRERPAAANRWSPRPPTRTGRAGRPGQRCR
jgi:hypothetical protein